MILQSNLRVHQPYANRDARIIRERSSAKHKKTSRLLVPATFLTVVCFGSTFAYAAYMKDFDAPKGNLGGVGVQTGRTSWFGQFGYGKYNNGKHKHVWRDTGDNGQNASGLPQTVPGIATANRKTLGGWYEVELKGKLYRVRQVDLGPAKYTGRTIDINAPLADMAGYTPNNFPTDSKVRYRYLGKTLPVEDMNIAGTEPVKKLEKLASLMTPNHMLDTSSLSIYERYLDENAKSVNRILQHEATKIVFHPPDLHKEAILNPADRPPQMVGRFPSGFHPVIKASMLEASKYLPVGYKVRFDNAARENSSVGSSSYHLKHDRLGALAVDIELIDPKGHALKNLQSPATFAMYRDFMHVTKKIQYEKFPAYRGKGRWGGYFVSGVSADLMHYDLGPEHETAAGKWETGLSRSYRHFGRPNDVGRGMGQIASFPLPNPFAALAGATHAMADMTDRSITAGMGVSRNITAAIPTPFKDRSKSSGGRRRVISDLDD